MRAEQDLTSLFNSAHFIDKKSAKEDINRLC